MDDVTMPEVVAEAVEATPELTEAVGETPAAEAVAEALVDMDSAGAT